MEEREENHQIVAVQPTQENGIIEAENENRDEKPFKCQKCNEGFKTHRGRVQHARQCKVNVRIAEPGQPPPEPPDIDTDPVAEEPLLEEIERFYWGEVSGSQISKEINACYEKIVFWRRNLFMLPNGAAGKNFIREVTRLLNSWVENSPMKSIAM